MKKLKIILGVSLLAVAGYFTIAADHIDAPAVMGGSSDITDFYAFRGENQDNIAFVANVKGFIGAGAESQNASFDENVLIEINIDTNADNVEDLVIQAIPRNGVMYVFGPYAPSNTGLNSSIDTNVSTAVVDVTPYGSNAIVSTNATSGIKVFAGLRDDPFFFDFAQYSEIIAGNATMFNNPGDDTFAGTNVMSVVVEVPKSLLGTGTTINSWVETKRKQ
jgi:hypothetical protein